LRRGRTLGARKQSGRRSSAMRRHRPQKLPLRRLRQRRPTCCRHVLADRCQGAYYAHPGATRFCLLN
jgi:hypothetical protein